MSGTSANCWLPNAGTPSRLAFGHRGHKLSESGPSNIENEGSSGDVDENKERQVSGVRCQVSGPSAIGWLPNTAGPSSRLGSGNCGQIARRRRGCNTSKMKVHPGMLMKTMTGRFPEPNAGRSGLPAPTVSCRTQGPLPASASAIVDKLGENGPWNISKMKVHPGMLMKTKKSRFQVPVPSVRPSESVFPTGGVPAGSNSFLALPFQLRYHPARHAIHRHP